MHSLPGFLEQLLGSSWRTAFLGLVLILLSFPVFILGAAVIYFGQAEIGGVIMGQGGIMLVGGVGFMLTRDHAASQKVAAGLKQETADLRSDVRVIEQDAVHVAAVVAQKEAQEVAEKVATEKAAIVAREEVQRGK